MKFKKLFVTGALGRVGQQVLPALSKEISLKLMDRCSGSIPIEGAVKGEADLPVEACDLLDFQSLCAAMEGCDTVLHLAIASERNFLKQYPGQPLRITADMTPEETAAFERAVLDVNVTGTYNLFEAARLAGVKRVIYMSSITIMLGYPDTEALTTPGAPPKPVNFYAVTKLFGEELGGIYHRIHGLDVFSLRLGQPYPLGTYLDDSYLDSARRRMVNTHFEDIEEMIRCTLKTDRSYGVINLTSQGDPDTLSMEEGAKIGYHPRICFHESGMERTKATDQGVVAN